MKSPINSHRPRSLLLWFPFIALLLAFSSAQARAQSATWNANPVDGDWDNPANWTPHIIPTTAIFGASGQTDVFISENTNVFDVQFGPGASAYTITALPGQYLLLAGDSGVTNNSGVVQSFRTSVDSEGNFGAFYIQEGGTAGVSTLFTNSGATQPGGPGGLLTMNDFLDAGNATIFNEGGSAAGAFGGNTNFLDAAKATRASITNKGGTASGALGGLTKFWDNASALDSTIVSEGSNVSGGFGGATVFILISRASNATLMATGGSNGGGGGSIQFQYNSSGNSARIEVFGNGNLDISALNSGALEIGSVEGDGLVLLGSKKLSIGTNNLSTAFSGVIQGTGSLSKVGTGTLTLSGASTYTGTTTVSAGALRASNRTGSATGSGKVTVSAGSLGGAGTIAGAVTIGTGSGAGATLAPSIGAGRPTTLTIQGALTVKADGSYSYKLNTKKTRADQVIANGVTIESGAQFDFSAVANRRLAAGTTFTAIGNTSATAIIGTFANLADGSTLTAGKNNYQVSYTGGDGNDLTLTVIR